MYVAIISTMDLLRTEYASDSSATTDGTPAVKPSGNAQNSASSIPAPSQNHAKEPDEAKPAAQQLSGNSNNKSGTSTSVGNHHRICAACQESKSRDEYSKNQWSKSHCKSRCKTCVGAPERPPRPAAAKRQKLNTQRNHQTKRSPDDVRIQVKFGMQWFPFVINKKKTVSDLKQLVCGDYLAGGVDQRYCHFRMHHSCERLKTSSTLENYLRGTGVSSEPRLELMCRRHPTKLDFVKYLFTSGDLVEIFRHSCPFRCISHPSDIHDLVGTYDIICDVNHLGASHDINLEAIPGLRMEIRPRGADHVEGSVFGRCLELSEDRDYITFNTENPFGLNEEGQSKVKFGVDYLTSENFGKCQMISVKRHEGDDETSFDYDSDEEDPNELKGSILVLKHRAFVPRSRVIRIVRDAHFPPEEGERMMNEYSSAYSSSFIRNHLSLPDSAGRIVFDYWRTEPPPCLVLEEGDVFIALGTGGDGSYVIARKNQKQKAISRFEAWKRQETKDLLLRAPPIAVATYPFEEEFQRLEKRKRRGLSK